MGGTGGSLTALGTFRVGRVETYAFAQTQIQGVMIRVDSTDTAVIVGALSPPSVSEAPGTFVEWVPRTGNPRMKTFPTGITPQAMALDADNGIWLAGQLYQDVTFGGPTLAAVENGYYIVKLAADGSHVFSSRVVRADNATPWALRTDPAGNAYLVGAIAKISSAYKQRVFVTKTSPQGTEIYNKEFPGTDTEAFAQDVVIAPSGEVVIGGFFNATVQFGATKLTSLAGLSTNGFVAVLDPIDGSAKRAFSFGGTIVDSVSSLSFTSSGALRVAGVVTGTGMMGGKSYAAAPEGSGFVAELSLSTGAATWLQLSAHPGSIGPSETDSHDRTFAVGNIVDANRLGTGTFLEVVDGTLMPLFPFQMGINQTGGLTGVVLDHHGGAWIEGTYQGTGVDFGMGVVPPSPDSAMPRGFSVHLEP
jgi:hypothetical protein